MTFTIGIISDTHGLLRPEALRILAHVDHIIHGGDIGHPEIITALRRIAPVTAIRGNVDTGDWATEFAGTEFVRLIAEPKSIEQLDLVAERSTRPILSEESVVVSAVHVGHALLKHNGHHFFHHGCADDGRAAVGLLLDFFDRGSDLFGGV